MLVTNVPVPRPRPPAWGRIAGQERAPLPKHARAIRVRLELTGRLRDLALFNMAVATSGRMWSLGEMSHAGLQAVEPGDSAHRRPALEPNRGDPTTRSGRADVPASLFGGHAGVVPMPRDLSVRSCLSSHDAGGQVLVRPADALSASLPWHATTLATLAVSHGPIWPGAAGASTA
jgi:hypothetical protein